LIRISPLAVENARRRFNDQLRLLIGVVAKRLEPEFVDDHLPGQERRFGLLPAHDGDQTGAIINGRGEAAAERHLRRANRLPDGGG
jgi:hypothetical protein